MGDAKNQYEPRYKWRETWPGEGHQDFAAWDGEESFGRIQLDTITHNRKGKWKWNVTHISWVRIHKGYVHGGWADDAREASRMVEELYDRLKDMHGR
jgi:hypothetical protein